MHDPSLTEAFTFKYDVHDICIVLGEVVDKHGLQVWAVDLVVWEGLGVHLLPQPTGGECLPYHIDQLGAGGVGGAVSVQPLTHIKLNAKNDENINYIFCSLMIVKFMDVSSLRT